MKRSLIFIYALALVSCEANNSITGTRDSGQYTYQAYDSLGTLIVSGVLSMNLADTDQVSGSWQMSNLNNRQDIGPQTGSGKLSGTLNDSQLVIDLNPDFRDNNVILSAMNSSGSFEGKWTWISFIGPTNWGTFKAENIRN